MIEPSRELRDVCAIVGAGNSRLGQVPGVSSLDLLVEAMRNAIVDAGLKVTDIDGIVCRGPDDIYAPSSADRRAARHQCPLLHLARQWRRQPDSRASRIATMAIKAGLATTVICGYGRDSWSRTHSSKEANVRNETRPDSQLAQEFGPEYGFFGAVAAHAFGATRHMHLYGTTRDQFGEIAIAFREHALRNPDAQMKKPLTMAQYHEARLIVAPFGLLDCSLRSDGAGAVIVTSRERARDLRQPPVLIKGFGSFNNLRGWFADDNMVVTAAKKSGETAYQMAGVGPTMSTPRRSTTASPTWC